MKFTHNNTAPGGNHYDCVVRTSLAKKEVLLDQQKSTPIREEMRIPEILKRSQNLEDVEVIDLTQEINTTGNSTGESSFGFEDAPAVKRGVCFPTYLYSEMKPTEVDRLPGEIDGTCWYRIKCSEKEYTENFRSEVVSDENKQQDWISRKKKSWFMSRLLHLLQQKFFILVNRRQT